MEDDSDIAFALQVEEALTASLLDGGVATSPSNVSVPYDAALGADLSKDIQDDHLYEYERLLLDHYQVQAETKRVQADLSRQIHDRAFACEIVNVPDGEWYKTGNYLSRPFGDGASSSSGGQGLGCRVYAKGLMGAIGVAICDGNDGLMFEMSKAFSEKEWEPSEVFFELKALVEGLDIAFILGFKLITIFTDCSLLHQFITGKNPKMPGDVVKLAEQIKVVLRKFSQIQSYHVAPEVMKYADAFAQTAIIMQHQHKRSAASSSTNNKTESCTICLEDTYVDQMFQITGCLHSYCCSCMMKHVQFKLLQGVLPKCPYEKCKSELKLDSCKKFLTPELFDIMSQHVKEASIPVEEKIYCPYPRCSALLSKTDLWVSRDNRDIVVGALGSRKCPRCSGVFCINCKVPWHKGMSCVDYNRLNPVPNEDRKLKSLAAQNLWRDCPKCKHMISLAAGCYHIYCRCGHEFCYTCGAEWKNKKATCSCPIWDERNIEYDHA